MSKKGDDNDLGPERHVPVQDSAGAASPSKHGHKKKRRNEPPSPATPGETTDTTRKRAGRSKKKQGVTSEAGTTMSTRRTHRKASKRLARKFAHAVSSEQSRAAPNEDAQDFVSEKLRSGAEGPDSGLNTTLGERDQRAAAPTAAKPDKKPPAVSSPDSQASRESRHRPKKPRPPAGASGRPAGAQLDQSGGNRRVPEPAGHRSQQSLRVSTDVGRPSATSRTPPSGPSAADRGKTKPPAAQPVASGGLRSAPDARGERRPSEVCWDSNAVSVSPRASQFGRPSGSMVASSRMSTSQARTLPERSTQLVREATVLEDVDEIVERMSLVKPMFQDRGRRSSYLLSADMEQYIHKHVISTSSGMEPTGQKLVAHKLCLVLLIVTLAIVLLLVYLLPDPNEGLVEVNTTSGRLRGFKTDFEGIPVYAFLGVPFGESTAFEARFRRPVPPENESVVRDATASRPPCVQSLGGVAGELSWNNTSEDCLHLNVWTPALPSRKEETLRTTLVLWYGRDFKWSGEYDGLPLSALGDMVVMVPNYRLHLLGFLGDGTDDAPGNVAFEDQRLALKWARDNAPNFGGNASRIVLHGHGSGSVSLGFQLMSLRKAEFQRAQRFVFQSGSPLRPLPNNTDPMLVSGVLGCNSSTDVDWECLRKKEPSAFVSPKSYQFLVAGPSFSSFYLPRKQGTFDIGGGLAESKEVLIGFMAEEGTFEIAAMSKLETESLAQQIFNQLRSVIATDLNELLSTYGIEASNCSGDWCTSTVKYLADLGYSVYPYLFDYKPVVQHYKDPTRAPLLYDDLAFVFGEPLRDAAIGLSKEQKLFSRHVIRIFSDFARTGRLPEIHSGVPWPNILNSRSHIVAIGPDALRLVPEDTKEKCRGLRKFFGSLAYVPLAERGSPPTKSPSQAQSNGPASHVSAKPQMGVNP